MAINIMDESNFDVELTRDMWVECVFDAREVVFVQRDGKWTKEDYDSSYDDHKSSNPNVEITFEFYGEKKDGTTFGPVKRNMMMRSSTKGGKVAEWKDITYPSLKNLGITDPASQIHHKWVHIQMQPTGEKFTSTKGDEIERDAPVFLAVYSSKDEAQAAQAAFWSERTNGNGNGNGNGTHKATNGNGNGSAPHATTANDQSKANVLQMLASMAGAARQMPDPRAGLQQMMSGMPMIADVGLTIDSPEVVALLTNTEEVPF